MGKLEKRLCKIRENRRNVRFDELDFLLRSFGFEVRQSGTGSSHYVYFRPGCMPIVLAKHSPVHPRAVKMVLDVLDELLEE